MRARLFALLAALILAAAFGRETSATGVATRQAQGDTVKAALQKAQSLFQQGNTVEASKIYTDIMKSYPDNKEAVQGWLMVNMKRSPTGEEEAIKQLEDLGKMYPGNTGILFFKMFIEAEHAHNDEALKDCETLIKLQPDTAVNYVAKGQVLYSMKKYSEAFDAFDKSVSLDPKRFDVWGMRAAALARLGKHDEAIASINKAFEIAPSSAFNIYNRACIYCILGDKANALADLKKAISMEPSFKQSAVNDEDFKNLREDEDFRNLTK